MKRQSHVIGRGVDWNMRRPITELRAGAVRMLTAELHPVVVAHRLARWHRYLHVQYVENDLGIAATGRQQTVTVGVWWVQRRVIY